MHRAQVFRGAYIFPGEILNNLSGEAVGKETGGLEGVLENRERPAE